jgi:hypothetical protein
MTKQVFYHYEELEEHAHGLWRMVSGRGREQYIEASAALMRNPSLFKDAMMRVLKRWPKSCEAAMTTPGLNRRAWMGHAGCCDKCGSPEELTRLGWHRLTPSEQDAANATADKVISKWTRDRNEQRAKEGTLF